MSIFNKFKKSLQKTRTGFTDQLKSVFSNNKGLTEDLIDEIEEALIIGDIGVDTTLELVEILRKKVKKERNLDYETVIEVLKSEIKNEIKESLSGYENNNIDANPLVIVVVGVNGAGKTTSIGKLANYYKKQGKSVVLAAADTFRAAAVDQLEVWRERVGVEIIKNNEGTDPAAVAFDSIQSVVAKKNDVLIVDTAGRIHTNVNLMQELEKISRVLKKVVPDAPHKVLLTIDGNTGQNAISQAKSFVSTIGVNGIILTKLDGTAKGGSVIPIIKNLKIPIEFIGTGEQKDDFEEFDLDQFIDALFE